MHCLEVVDSRMAKCRIAFEERIEERRGRVKSLADRANLLLEETNGRSNS